MWYMVYVVTSQNIFLYSIHDLICKQSHMIMEIVTQCDRFWHSRTNPDRIFICLGMIACTWHFHQLAFVRSIGTLFKCMNSTAQCQLNMECESLMSGLFTCCLSSTTRKDKPIAYMQKHRSSTDTYSLVSDQANNLGMLLPINYQALTGRLQVVASGVLVKLALSSSTVPYFVLQLCVNKKKHWNVCEGRCRIP